MTVADYQRLPAVPADERVRYGPEPDQFADLYRPSGPGPHPVAIVLHGGCWQQGYGLSPLGRFCRACSGLGFAAWSVEYRRLGAGGGFPQTFLDVALAAERLRDLAAPYALDLARVVTVGHSAGGHLALWLAGRHRIAPSAALGSRDPLAVRGVLALAAIGDLERGAALGICGGACAGIVAGPPADLPARLAQASPRELLPLGAAQHHLVGDADTLVPADYVREYVERARALERATLEVLPGIGHFELVVPEGPAWASASRALAGLIATAPRPADRAPAPPPSRPSRSLT